jgi:hypothetical protein
MSLGYNPQIKFQPDLSTREGLEKIAKAHSLGGNGESANEVMNLVSKQFAKVHPRNFFLALAALEDFKTVEKRSGPKRSAAVPPLY